MAQRNIITKSIHGDSSNYVGEKGELFYSVGDDNQINLRYSDGLTIGGLPAANSASSIHGFADYNDTASSASPVAVAADTWTTLPNNGSGSFSQERLPDGIDTMLHSSGAIDPRQLPLFSDILIRMDFTVTPSSNNAAISFRYALGSGAGEYTLEKRLARLDVGAGIPYRQSLTVDYIYMGDLNTRDNIITPQIYMSTPGAVVNAGMAIKVMKR